MREMAEDTLLLCVFPHQPIHCLLPLLEPAEFALGDGLQRLVKDLGQTLGAHQRRTLHMWSGE